jgi:glutaredoxin
LNTLGITLIELDVQKDPEKRKEQLRKSGGQTSIPLLDIEGTIVHGYDPPQLQSVIEERRSALRPY